MKKFYDIKVREKEKNFQPADNFQALENRTIGGGDEFWSEQIFKNRQIERPEKKTRKKIDFNALKSSFLRGLSVFAILLSSMAFFYVKGVDAKGEVEKRVESAKLSLNQAVSSLDSGDFSSANEELLKVKEDLKIIKINAQSWGQDVQYFGLIATKKSKALELEEFLNVCDQILSNITELQSVLGSALSGIDSVAVEDGEDTSINIYAISENLLPKVVEANQKIRESKNLLEKIEGTDLIGEKDFLKLSNKVISLSRSLNYTEQILKGDLPWLTAKDGNRNILILFQNNTEIRPSGGFLGSFGVLRFQDGVLVKIDFEKNIYKLDKEFYMENHIDPPGELVNTTEHWSMINSNWWLNVPDSFEEVENFYELESGESVDGVIALDTTLFLRILEKIGPIEMPEYGLTVTSENFLKDIQYEVEVGYFEREGNSEENEPKKILAQMMPKFLNQFFSGLQDKEKVFSLLNTLGSGIEEKHLLFHMDNEDFQERLVDLNMVGALQRESDDYLYVTSTNIGGLKSSLNVKETISLDSWVGQESMTENELTLERVHNGSYDWPDGVNKNYVRVLIPLGAEVTNFEAISGNFQRMYENGLKDGSEYWIDEEAGYTRINFWMNTEPGNTSKVKINYRFKTDLSDDYKTIFQKQPGLENSSLNYSLRLPNSSNVYTKSFNLKKDIFLRLNLN